MDEQQMDERFPDSYGPIIKEAMLSIVKPFLPQGSQEEQEVYI